MLVSDSFVNPDGSIVVELKSATLFVDHLSLFIEDRWANHPGQDCNEAFCLILPPRWTWLVGITWRFSLGRILGNLGQFVSRRSGNLKVVHSAIIDECEAVEIYGWDAADLQDALHWLDEDDD